MGTADVRKGSQHHVAKAQRPTNQHNLKLDPRTHGEFARTKKKDAGGADVAGHQRDRILFRDAIDASQAQGELQGSAGVFALFRMHADSVRWHPLEAARLWPFVERQHAQGWDTELSRALRLSGEPQMDFGRSFRRGSRIQRWGPDRSAHLAPQRNDLLTAWRSHSR